MPNRLADETSPYLLQHKDNPVDWLPWGEEARALATRARRPDPALDRLLGLPLVPRDGARVVRGRGDRRLHERALRADQGRPRGAPRRRRDLHGGRAGDDRPRRLAADRLLRPRRRPLPLRHLLPARAAAGHAELPDGASRRCIAGLARAAARRSAPPPARTREQLGAIARIPAPDDEIDPRPRRRGGRRRSRRAIDPVNGGFGARAEVPAGERARPAARPRRAPSRSS